MLLTVTMLLGTIASLAIFNVSAADATTDESTDKEDDKDKNEPSEEEIIEETVKAYLTTKYDSPQAKVATMQLKLDKDGYQLYVDPLTGETATVNKASGQILFSNPWDIDTKGATNSENVASEVMSQVAIKYTENGTEKFFHSFTEAAMRGQIKVKNIKNGIRVEYIIGREEAKKLVPRSISVTRFETLIVSFLVAAFEDEGGRKAWEVKRFLDWYNLMDPDKSESPTVRDQMYAKYPITKVKPIYILDVTTPNVIVSWLEERVKTYCPHYTYEELDFDHEDTLYVGTDTNPPLFKMAIEYTLDEYGMTWRMPANGLRFDESLYQLSYISILPYMGAGANYGGYTPENLQEGYTFFPDGSGALFDFQQLNTKTSTTISAKVYGQDYAYHTISGGLSEVVRYPVFGIVEQQNLSLSSTDKVVTSEAVIDPVTGEILSPEVVEEVVTVTPYTEDKGFVAIVEEGDALAEIATTHASNYHKYNSVQMFFYPRPRDSYNIADAISVGQNKTWTVVSSRKYVGSYKVRYIMLTDDRIAAEKGITDYYPCSWMGMARAYSNYLEDKGVLTRLTEDDVLDNIPLYIETFGTFETIEKILSIPVNVMTPLTTFDNIRTMFDELSDDGVTNINFKLTGFANGGYYSSVPYKLKWEKAVGGESGFEELLDYAKDINAGGEKHLGIYPDFDFVYAQHNGIGDGLSLKKHAVKTIDDRYTSKRVYSATYQSYESYFQLALSPAYFEYFYDSFTERYLKYDPIGISVSTLGSDLNSDFDEDEPYNREDSKAFTVNIFKKLSEDYKNVMTDNGNAYVWKYVNHIIDMPLDSSRYIKSSNSVPFMGTVLHGYIQTAGTPYNMEGNTNYAFLKAIENGASLYFTLTYGNTTKFKEDMQLSKYYSISYDIWYNELVEVYTELNNLLKDVQTKVIIDHQFLRGERVPDADELEADILKMAEEALKAEEEAVKEAAAAAIAAVAKARSTLATATESTQKTVNTISGVSASTVNNYANILAKLQALADSKQNVLDLQIPLNQAYQNYLAAVEAYKAAGDAFTAHKNGVLQNASNAYNTYFNAHSKDYADAVAAINSFKSLVSAWVNGTNTVDTTLAALEEAKKGTDAEAIAAAEKAYNDAVAALEASVKAMDDANAAFAADANASAESKAFYAECTALFKKYGAEMIESKRLQNTTIAKNAAQAEAMQAYTAAQNDVHAAEELVVTANNSLNTAVSSMINVYRTLVNQLELSALNVHKRAVESMQTLLNTNAVPDAIINEGSANYAIVLENVSRATLNAISTIPSVLTGIKETVANDLLNVNSYEESLKAATNTLKDAIANYKAVAGSENPSASALNNAKSTYNNAKAALATIVASITNVGNVSANKASTSAAAYTSALLYKTYVDDSASLTAAEKAAAAEELAKIESLNDELQNAHKLVEAKIAEYNTLLGDLATITINSTNNDTTTPDEPTVDDEVVEEDNTTKYTNDDGNIVLVTYGGKNGVDNDPFKSFILNFNYFAVIVELNGKIYTIPANGYVVIYN